MRVCALCPGPVETEFFDRAGMPHDYFPAYLNRSAERVAREGYEGFMGGHRVVVPGKPNRIMTLLPRLLPRGLMLAMTAMALEADQRLRLTGFIRLLSSPSHDGIGCARIAGKRIMAETSNADVKKMPFERAIEELESIVKRLEEGKVPLEESVAIYERGEALKKRCEELLRQAEARVEKITLDASGKPTGSEPLDVD